MVCKGTGDWWQANLHSLCVSLNPMEPKEVHNTADTNERSEIRRINIVY